MQKGIKAAELHIYYEVGGQDLRITELQSMCPRNSRSVVEVRWGEQTDPTSVRILVPLPALTVFESVDPVL